MRAFGQVVQVHGIPPILRVHQFCPHSSNTEQARPKRQVVGGSSTAIERPDASGGYEFDAHRECQFRRAVEFGLSDKRETASGFDPRPSRQMAGFPTRPLSVAQFIGPKVVGYLILLC